MVGKTIRLWNDCTANIDDYVHYIIEVSSISDKHIVGKYKIVQKSKVDKNYIASGTFSWDEVHKIEVLPG